MRNTGGLGSGQRTRGQSPASRDGVPAARVRIFRAAAGEGYFGASVRAGVLAGAAAATAGTGRPESPAWAVFSWTCTVSRSAPSTRTLIAF
jgi:hypothetical protein